jgi:hypothetical protein
MPLAAGPHLRLPLKPSVWPRGSAKPPRSLNGAFSGPPRPRLDPSVCPRVVMEEDACQRGEDQTANNDLFKACIRDRDPDTIPEGRSNSFDLPLDEEGRRIQGLRSLRPSMPGASRYSRDADETHTSRALASRGHDPPVSAMSAGRESPSGSAGRKHVFSGLVRPLLASTSSSTRKATSRTRSTTRRLRTKAQRSPHPSRSRIEQPRTDRRSDE